MQSDGTVAYVLPTNSPLKRPDGLLAQPGDVYSQQPDGSAQARPASAIGPWEKATREGVMLIYGQVLPGVQFLVLPVQG